MLVRFGLSFGRGIPVIGFSSGYSSGRFRFGAVSSSAGDSSGQFRFGAVSSSAGIPLVSGFGGELTGSTTNDQVSRSTRSNVIVGNPYACGKGVATPHTTSLSKAGGEHKLVGSVRCLLRPGSSSGGRFRFGAVSSSACGFSGRFRFGDSSGRFRFGAVYSFATGFQ